MPQVVAWRRDIHEHPELSNREDAHLEARRRPPAVARARGADRRRAHRRGGRPPRRPARPGGRAARRHGRAPRHRAGGPPLPVHGAQHLQRAGGRGDARLRARHSTPRCCMGAAEVLAGMRDRAAGHREVHLPAGGGGHARRRGRGRLDDGGGGRADRARTWTRSSGCTSSRGYPVGHLSWRRRGIMASGDKLRIVVRGRQTHGAMPWAGVDPIVVGSQIVTGLQTITSRQIDAHHGAGGGHDRHAAGRRALQHHPRQRGDGGDDPHLRPGDAARASTSGCRRTAEMIAQSAGAEAEVKIPADGNPVTYNDPALTARMGLRRCSRVAGEGNYSVAQATTTAEDFSHLPEAGPGASSSSSASPRRGRNRRRRAEPLAALLRRRGSASGGREGAGVARGGLPGGGEVGGGTAAPGAPARRAGSRPRRAAPSSPLLMAEGRERPKAAAESAAEPRAPRAAVPRRPTPGTPAPPASRRPAPPTPRRARSAARAATAHRRTRPSARRRR